MQVQVLLTVPDPLRWTRWRGEPTCGRFVVAALLGANATYGSSILSEGARSKEGRKAGVLIGLENRDDGDVVWVRSPCLPPDNADVAETD